jgi:hypothetical protein
MHINFLSADILLGQEEELRLGRMRTVITGDMLVD